MNDRWPYLALHLLLTLLLSTAPGCRRTARKGTFKDRPDGLTGGTLIFSDDFDRSELNPDPAHPRWKTPTNRWKIENNALHNAWDQNGGAWWTGRLPRRVRVEFTAWSANPPNWLPCQRHPQPQKGKREPSFQGDLKFEIFNNEAKHATGYSCVYGGWLNQTMMIGRLGEHAPAQRVYLPNAEFARRRVQPGRKYRMKIVRTDNVLRWYIDDSPNAVLVFADSAALNGPWFGFNNWCAHVYFDDLKIYRL